MADENFERLVKYLPVSWETALSKGLAYLANELDSRGMKLKIMENGVGIMIKCDEDGQRKAAKFWKENVQDKTK